MRVVLDFGLLRSASQQSSVPGAEPDRCNPGSHAEQEFGCLVGSVGLVCLVGLVGSRFESEFLGHAR